MSPKKAGSPPGGGAATSPGMPSAQWQQILQAVKGQKNILHAILIASLHQEVSEGKLLILFDPDKGRFHKERSEETDNLQILREAAGQVLGAPVSVECGYLGGEPGEDPVQKAIEIFGRDIVKIE